MIPISFVSLSGCGIDRNIEPDFLPEKQRPVLGRQHLPIGGEFEPSSTKGEHIRNITEIFSEQRFAVAAVGYFMRYARQTAPFFSRNPE